MRVFIVVPTIVTLWSWWTMNVEGFMVVTTKTTKPRVAFTSSLAAAAAGNEDEDSDGNLEGRSLAADFFKAMQERNIQLERDDLLEAEYEDDDEDDEDEEEEEINFPQGAINAMTGFDSGDVGKLAGNVTLTNQQVYSELKERVLESAGAFVELVGGADEEEDENEDEDSQPQQRKPYVTPEVVPDSGLTAGEVVTTVLLALLHNDVPYRNRGIEVFFRYSSPGSAVYEMVHIEGMTPDEYAEFLLSEESSEYQILFEHAGDVVIEKGDYSFDRKKAFFTARLNGGAAGYINVNFILSTSGHGEDDCWLIDSMLIRPEGMRRRRRR